MIRIHLADLDDPRFQIPFQAAIAGHPIEVVPGDQPHEVLVAGVATRAQLERAPRTLIIPWSGVPRSVATLLQDYPAIAVHNLHYNAAPVAEHAVGMLLAASRRMLSADAALRRGDWRPRFQPSDAPLLAGRKALILGAGAIAQRIAQALAGLAVTPTLLATTARPATQTCPWPTLAPNDLDQALIQAEVLVVTLPLTPATDGLIDQRRLALLPPGALVINVGRGPVIDEAALFRALESGRIAAAGIDVWYDYPKGEAARAETPPSQFDFASLDHVVLSPHRAGHGAESDRLCAEYLAAALIRAANGDPIGSQVDPAKGY